MRLIKGKKYRVFWHDIHSSAQWMSVEDVYKWIDKDDDTAMIENLWTYVGSHGAFRIFCSGKAGDGQLFGTHIIPKSLKLEIKELK